MVEVFGWLAGVLFAVCVIPQALKCWNDGHAEGISSTFLWLWMLAEVAAVIAEGYEPLPRLFRLFNYSFGIFALTIIFRYKYWPRKVTNTIKLSVVRNRIKR